MAGAPSRLRDYEIYQRVGTKGPIWMFGLNGRSLQRKEDEIDIPKAAPDVTEPDSRN